MRELLGSVAAESVGVVGSATGLNQEGCKLEFEWLALPLSRRLATDACMLGVLAPTEMPYWIGISVLEGLRLGSFRYLESERRAISTAHLGEPLVARIRRGLVVYEGGQG